MATESEQKEAFMLGLTKLTRETGVVISGCGCCGSPGLDIATPADLEDSRAGYGYEGSGEVGWLSPHRSYSWEQYKDSIVRGPHES